jgi:hypothetical protein
MITYYVISGICLIISIILFFTYNSGSGGALSSFNKRLIYFLSILSFLAFVFFLTKAYYYNDNQQNKQMAQELRKEYIELEKGINLSKDTSTLKIQEKQFLVKALIQQLDNETHKEYDTYFNIFIGILTAFIGWVIVFTFRNKILG